MFILINLRHITIKKMYCVSIFHLVILILFSYLIMIIMIKFVEEFEKKFQYIILYTTNCIQHNNSMYL